MKYGVVIPTYNESSNVERLVSQVRAIDPKLHFIFVDDSSPDGTGDIVKKIISKHPEQVKLITQKKKMGLGAAYIKGISEALDDGWDLICEMDADFSHQPKYLPELIKWTSEYDLVMGSRYIPGGGVVNWDFFRRFLSRYGNLYARMVLGAKIKDMTSGFKCYRRQVLESIDLCGIKSNGYSFQIETVYRSLINGFTIKEIPIVFVEREQGQSKMSRSIIHEAIFMVWKLRLNRKKLLQPRKTGQTDTPMADNEREANLQTSEEK